MIDTTLIANAASVIFVAGAAWGGARASLNGTRKRTERMEVKVDELRDSMAENHSEVMHEIAKTTERVARLEAFRDASVRH